MSIRRNAFMVGVMAVAGAIASADLPEALSRGQAPLLFTSSEGSNAASPTMLRDGQAAVGDDIWLWVPSIGAGGMVDLATTGSFYKVWDSGPVAGPNGNDDDRNGMRGMDFDQTTGSFLISYEDSTTTGFDFGGIRDGALMRMSPTSVSGGFITGHSFTELYGEGDNGTPGFMSTDDITGVALASDGSLFWHAGSQNTPLQNTVGGTTPTTSNAILHTEGLSSASPRNIGPDVFYEAGPAGSPDPFTPGNYLGQVRGIDELITGEILFGTSGEYSNTVFDGSGVPIGIELAFSDADIATVDLATRFGSVVYSGDLFFDDPDAARILDFDILDTFVEGQALIDLLGADSPAGLALAPFFVPAPGALSLIGLGAVVGVRRRRR